MSATANKTTIGVFVLVAVTLAVAAVVALGSGLLFTEKYTCIMYFENSVSGLEVGAPVVFRGVPIGLVKEISLEADPAHMHFYIPVVVEIVGGKIKLVQSGKAGAKDASLVESQADTPNAMLAELVDRGLRAQLITQSFVTGQLAVSLDLMPDTPLRLVGRSNLPEIPTVPSTFDRLTQTIKRLPLEELVNRLTSAVTGFEKLVNSPELCQMPAKLDNALNTGTDLLRQVRDKVSPLADSLDDAARSVSDLAKHLDHRTEGLSSSAGKTLETLNAALKDGKSAIGKFEKVVNADSPTVTDLNRALSEMAGAARSIRELANYLERHPEALLQGKGGPRK